MKPFNPESFLVNATSAKTVSRLSPEECKQWITEVVKNYEAFVEKQQGNKSKEPKDHQPTFADNLVGDLVKQTWSAQQAGLQTWWRRYIANPTGKASGNPEG